MPGTPEPTQTVGSKAQVFHGTAKRTAGGLKKADLMQTDKGRIVSKKAHAAGLVAIKRLRNAGFVAKKGEFKLFSKESKKAAPAPAPVKSTVAKKAAPVKRTVAKTRAMSKENHKKAHNRAVKAWTTRRAAPKKVASKGGFADERKNSRKNERKNSRKNGGFADERKSRKDSRKDERKDSRKNGGFADERKNRKDSRKAERKD